MKVLRAIDSLSEVPGPQSLAIGVFDGVHPGHRAVIERALSGAKSSGGTAVVVTFDPHPARILRPDKAPRLLTSTPHKARLIEALGASHLLVIPFTREFAATDPREFIVALHRGARDLREICVGHAWSFGRGRAGNLQMLAELGQELGFAEVGIPAVKVDEQIVSSTVIRSAVAAGDLARAARYLGRDFSILGTVVSGAHLGGKLGFPTANLAAHNEQFPPNGVYAVEVLLNGRMQPGVANIGVRPTVEEKGARVLEVHLLDFKADIYGRDVELFFRHRIRDELKFPDVDSLKRRIAQDIAAARKLL